MNKYKLGELIEITSSKRIHAEDYVEYGVPFYRSKEIIQLSKGEKITEVLHISKEQYNKIKSRFPIPKNGDILLTSVGTIGIPYYVRDENFYFKDGNLTWFRNFSEKVNSKYLLFWMQSNFFKSQIDNNNIGAVQKALTIDFLKKFNIQLPNLNEQKKITSTLTSIISKIELNNKINAKLEAMAKTLYDYWFVQFDFPDVNGKPYKSSGGKMVWNDDLKREIPEGWEVHFITNEMDLQYGFPFSTNLFNEDENGVPIIRIRDILNCTISNYSTEKVDKKYKLNKGDVLVGMDGNFHINYWYKDNCYLNQRTLRIRSNKNSISEMQARFSIEPYIKAREKNVSRTTVAHLSAKDVNDLKILKGNLEIQNKANEFFKSTLKKIISNSIENQQLASLRDWLLPMLMNGQVSVASTSSATKDGYEVEERELGMVAEGGVEYRKR